MLHAGIGRFEQALSSAAAAAAIGDATGDPRLQSFAAWVSGMALAGRGEHEAAIGACRRALESAMDPLGQALGAGWLGVVLLEAGDGAAAIPHLETSVAELLRIGIRHSAGRQAAFLAEALLLAGKHEAAPERASQGLALCRETRFPHGVGIAERALGRIALAAGDRDGARRQLEAALGCFTAIGAIFESARTRQLLAQVTGESRHLDEARRELRSIEAVYWLEKIEAAARRAAPPPPLTGSGPCT
jgi:tetratricopeptide (TPR) repeat protein